MDLHHLLLAGLPAHSALPRSTDIVRLTRLVRFVPTRDSCAAAGSVFIRSLKSSDQEPCVSCALNRRWENVMILDYIGIPVAQHGVSPPSWCPRKARQGPLIGIGCPNEDHGPAVCFHVGRMRWRSAESADKMRSGLGGFIKSIYNTPPRGGSDGNGPEQPLLRKLTAAKLWRTDVAFTAP
jgi:hypothetical protein